MSAASEWRDILFEALRAALILAILERLCLTRHASWLEDHLDYLSLQALLLRDTSLSVWGRTRHHFAHTKRLDAE